MKKLCRSKLNNAGLSLVEVIVTMVVIAIISVPIIKSFVTTARVNHSARRLQNATDVAQQVAERFETIELDTLLSDYASNVTYDGNPDVKIKPEYNFEDIPMTGAEGENFSVSVKMTSAGHDFFDIPSLKNLYGANKCLCFRQINKYDNRALLTFGVADGSNVMKTTKIIVKNSVDSRQYDYKVLVEYRYGSQVLTYENVIESRKLKDGEENFPTLYVMYEPLDKVNGKNAGTGSNDKVEIHYEIDTPTAVKEPMRIYFLTQGEIDEFGSYLPMYVNESHIKLIHKDEGDLFKKTVEFHNLDLEANRDLLTKGDKTAVIYALDISVKYNDKVITNVNSLRRENVAK